MTKRVSLAESEPAEPALIPLKRGRKSPALDRLKDLIEDRRLRDCEWLYNDCYLGEMSMEEYWRESFLWGTQPGYFFVRIMPNDEFFVSCVTGFGRELRPPEALRSGAFVSHWPLHWSQSLIYRNAVREAFQEVLVAIFLGAQSLWGRDVARLICQYAFALRKHWFDFLLSRETQAASRLGFLGKVKK